jgi:two-component sensor histidine kinase
VLTELLQNAVQHGYPTTDGERDGGEQVEGDGGDEERPAGRVVVSFDNDGSELVVRVRDDGVGLPAGFTLERPNPNLDRPTLGLTIVRTLVTTELGGTIEMRTDGGTVVELRMPISAGIHTA